jgi:dTMP kinase
MPGLFITFEGTEGGGKSTQIALLVERLRSLGFTVRALREPGGTALGEEIRHLLKHSTAGSGMSPTTELLLMNASRAQLVQEVIQPALQAGEIVLCDRFFDSTVAYQAFGRGLPLAQVRDVVEVATGGLKPHLTLLLRVPVHVSEARRAARGTTQRDRFEEADRAFFQRVENGFEQVAAADPERVKVIDAERSVEEVAGQIWEQVQPLLPAASRS